MVAITFLLALLVLLMLQIQPLAWNMEKEIPVIFTITSIKSVDELTGHLNYDSRVLLLHTGKTDVQNKNLKARFLKNGQPVSCTIATMNGHDYHQHVSYRCPVDGRFRVFRGNLEPRGADLY